jgi:hypothetical protein
MANSEIIGAGQDTGASCAGIPKRKQREKESEQVTLFDIEDNWKNEWWGMPEFSNDDIRPAYRLTVNFLTLEDKKMFAEKLQQFVSPQSDTIWYPSQERLAGCQFFYDGEKTDSKYPICIPSKGRADVQTTGKVLDSMGVSYRFFVEEKEAEEYKKHLGSQRVVVMPFSDLGQGSIPARNFIWEWAKENGYKRHWTVDDNITEFRRTNITRRLKVKGGGFFKAMEDFVDRYENIAIAGPHHLGFVKVGWSNIPPYLLNTRVYSCILLDTTLPHRWRGRYNEDTDLSLRLLKDGYCSCVFAALLMNKAATVGVRNCEAMKGGNTDNVYNTGDSRLAFAESLKEQHPDCVEVVWKFNRWHHQVDYSRFKNKLILKQGITKIMANNEYGMRLINAKESPLVGEESPALDTKEICHTAPNSAMLQGLKPHAGNTGTSA